MITLSIRLGGYINAHRGFYLIV